MILYCVCSWSACDCRTLVSSSFAWSIVLKWKFIRDENIQWMATFCFWSSLVLPLCSSGFWLVISFLFRSLNLFAWLGHNKLTESLLISHAITQKLKNGRTAQTTKQEIWSSSSWAYGWTRLVKSFAMPRFYFPFTKVIWFMLLILEMFFLLGVLWFWFGLCY